MPATAVADIVNKLQQVNAGKPTGILGRQCETHDAMIYAIADVANRGHARWASGMSNVCPRILQIVQQASDRGDTAPAASIGAVVFECPVLHLQFTESLAWLTQDSSKS